MCNCARWPLMIDPQLQGVTWIKKREEKHGLTVARLGQKGLLPSLEAALVAGMPFLIESLQESYDAVLAPVVGRQVRVRVRVRVRFGLGVRVRVRELRRRARARRRPAG